ncbi:MAG: beta-propeller fold lactonase family protein [Steroidobacteraceae bacterium]
MRKLSMVVCPSKNAGHVSQTGQADMTRLDCVPDFRSAANGGIQKITNNCNGAATIVQTRILILPLICLFSACGGSSTNAPATYAVGGSVGGLVGSGLVLQNNSGNDLAISASGAFVFTAQIANNNAFNVTVKTQPSNPTQTCTVGGGSGTVSGANVSSVVVSCVTNTYALGGTVKGLNGTGLVLQNNAGSDLLVSANGTFAFTGSVASGTSYNVTIKTQPTAVPAQTCSLANGAGTVGGLAVTNIVVACRNLVGHFLYVPNNGSSNVSAYVINPNTGELTPVLGSPFAAGAGARLATADPANKFLYVTGLVSGAQATLAGYSINPATGALTAVSTAPYNLGSSGALTVGKPLIHQSGNFLYVTAAGTATYGFSINSTTGELVAVAGSPYLTGGSATQTGTLDASGRFLYVPYGIATAPTIAGAVLRYQVDSTTGALSPLGSVSTGGNNPIRVNIHPTGKFAYVPNAGSANLAAFNIDSTTGALTVVGGSPYTTGLTPLNAAFSSSGSNFYLGNTGNTGATPGAGSISAFSVNAVSGALIPITGSPVATGGNNAQGIVIYPNGKYALVNNISSASVAIYGINNMDGSLTPVVGSPFSTPSTSPGRVIVDPSGRFAYLTDTLANTITALSIDASLGTITVVGSYPTGTTPTNIPEIVGLQ